MRRIKFVVAISFNHSPVMELVNLANKIQKFYCLAYVKKRPFNVTAKKYNLLKQPVFWRFLFWRLWLVQFSQ